MNGHIDKLRDLQSRAVVGIEAGSVEGKIGAVLAEVRGSGDDTFLDLHSYHCLDLPGDLVTSLKALASGKDMDPEDSAGINFLLLNHINSLYHELLETAGASGDDIDLIGLKGIEIAGRELPEDPGVLSEMTGTVVASCFRIGPETSPGMWLPVKESILQGLIGAMVEEKKLEPEVREAVAVALLANESVYHESLNAGCHVEGEDDGARPSRIVRSSGSGGGEAALHGEFFFPA